MKMYRLLFIVMALGVFCTSSYADNLSPLPQSPDAYAAQAKQSVGADKQFYLLQAVAAYFYSDQPDAARRLLNQVQVKDLSPIGLTQFQLLRAKVALNSHQPDKVLHIVDVVGRTPNVTPTQQIELLQLKAAAQQDMNQAVESFHTLQMIQPLLNTTSATRKNQIAMWRSLQLASTPDLQSLITSGDGTNAGWASLVLLTRTWQATPQTWLQQLHAWRRQYPQHEANALLVDDLAALIKNYQPITQVALLLPLTGPAADAGLAVRNGFLGAFYGHPASITIRIYDTHNANIVNLYQQAIAAGANRVVGPLLKNDVDALKASGNITVPTLALNYSSDASQAPAHFYQFALSPEEEAQAVAARAWQLGYKKALVISPQSAWGNGIAQAFSIAWQNLGGQVNAQLAYVINADLGASIAKILHIDYRVARKTKTPQQHRQDIDMIFLNAPPAQAREIVPLLRFFYAGDLPIFATSQLYNGMPSAGRDSDLNGIQFPLMPWALNPTTDAKTLRQNFAHLFGSDFQNNSLLYGFGLDAYQLLAGLTTLQAMPDISMSGMTGQLTLASNAQIQRQTPWARFTQGVPAMVPTNIPVIALLPSQS